MTEPRTAVPIDLAAGDLGVLGSIIDVPRYDRSNLTRSIVHIGDGLTPEGDPQQLLVPDDATRLYLGYLARFNEANPEPGWYGDNSGMHEVIVAIDVPE